MFGVVLVVQQSAIIHIESFSQPRCRAVLKAAPSSCEGVAQNDGPSGGETAFAYCLLCGYFNSPCCHFLARLLEKGGELLDRNDDEKLVLLHSAESLDAYRSSTYYVDHGDLAFLLVAVGGGSQEQGPSLSHEEDQQDQQRREEEPRADMHSSAPPAFGTVLMTAGDTHRPPLLVVPPAAAAEK